MKVYTCSNCQNPLYFENSQCLNCAHAVGFDPAQLTMITLVAGKGDTLSGVANDTLANVANDAPSGVANAALSDVANAASSYRYCKNAEYGTCNWLIPAGSDQSYCEACQLNRVIPSLTNKENRLRWKNMEVAKHRLIYSLLRLRLPFHSEKGGQKESLQFDFMADPSPGEKVMTGHDNGLITINIEEADEGERVRHKLDLGERYRTLLGHFRHESGHYYWDVLVKDGPLLEKFREFFGDERKDYGAALEAYYANGPAADWNQHFVSQYATAHPWEDWAETWAHYLHMMDTLETAWAFGIRIDPAELDENARIRANIVKEPYGVADFNWLIKRWLPLCFAVNSLNRSMGHADFYPFILSVSVIGKLRFIHEVCQSGGQS